VVGVAVTILGGGVLLSEVDNGFRALLPLPQWLWNLVKDLFLSQDKLFSRIFLLVFVAPLGEELLFRGIILRGLLSRHRPAVAVVLTALLFAALHCNPWQFLSALFLGIAFGWFYLRTGSVGLCVLAHAFCNGMSIVVVALPLNIPGLVGTEDYTKAVFQPWWLDCAGLVLVLVGLWTFRRAAPPAQTPPAQAPPIIGLNKTV
jgi:membrane protease YdiL (CAAX protease family)